jgi:hypothetical protein
MSWKSCKHLHMLPASLGSGCAAVLHKSSSFENMAQQSVTYSAGTLIIVGCFFVANLRLLEHQQLALATSEWWRIFPLHRTKPNQVDSTLPQYLTSLSSHPDIRTQHKEKQVNSLARQTRTTWTQLARALAENTRQSVSPPGRRLGNETRPIKENKARINGEIHGARTEIRREHSQIGPRASRSGMGRSGRERARTAGKRVPSFFLIFVALPPTRRRARCRLS